MVYIAETVGQHSGSIDKVWEMISALTSSRASDVHPDTTDNESHWLNASTLIQQWKPKNTRVIARMKMTLLHPVGVAFKPLSGSFSGTKYINYFRPMGEKTESAVVGDFRSPTIPEDKLEKVVREFLKHNFEIEERYIKEIGSSGTV